MLSRRFSVGTVLRAAFLMCLFFISFFWFPFVFGDPFLTDTFVGQSTIQSRLAGAPESWPWQLSLAVRYSGAVWLRLAVATSGLTLYVVIVLLKPHASITEGVFQALIWAGLAGIYICFAGIFVVV